MRRLTALSLSPHRPDSPNSSPIRCRNVIRLKRRAQRAEMRTATTVSFPRKPRDITAKVSGGRWLARRKGSTADLERQSQGSQRAVEDRGPPRGLAGDVQGRVETVERNPPEGRHRAAGLYRMRPVPSTTSTLLYENASGLQLTPSKGAQVLTWTTRWELNLGWMTLALSRVRRNLCAKRAKQNLPPLVSTAFL